MRIGLVLPMGDERGPGIPSSGREIFGFARDMEQAGFDSLWLFDHLQAYEGEAADPSATWEAWTLLAGLAATTERASLGTIVTCTGFRPPALLARMAHSVHEISGGRLILGLGAGWHEPEYRAFGYPFDHRYSRFEEALTVIRGMLVDGSSTFDGQYYRTNDARLLPPPTQPAPPILIGTHGPRMLALTAKYAQAYNTSWHALPAERWTKVKASLEQAGVTQRVTVGLMVKGDNASDDAFGVRCEPGALAEAFQRWAAEGIDELIVLLDPATVDRAERTVQALHDFRASTT
ncbi:LLM class flavin-dependent oxidoreductase [Rhizocola hellebori]|nr:LLM class flavin-dependent oxidoreductase [Rhizocola hellebori]